jgi:acetolactate synthase small subunit
MEVTVVTGLFAKRDVNINAAHATKIATTALGKMLIPLVFKREFE